jgi:pyridoxamine 5'-phosphate oxidase-like protein
MTATLPSEIQDVFERFVTTEFVTIDERGQPVAWPLTPYYHHGEGCIDVTTGIGYPKKANDAEHNPQVALLFSDPRGSHLHDPPTVLVQGTARVDDGDLDALRERYRREMAAKLPAAAERLPPRFVENLAKWYFFRLYIHVRPERVYVWRSADTEPELFDAHVEEVRSGHNEEPEEGHADPEGGSAAWDARMDELGSRYDTAVLSFVCPDGFPFAVRVPVRTDTAQRLVHIDRVPAGAPVEPGLACLTAHAHDERFTWQQNFQVRGDLVQTADGGWALAPHKLVGGFELPPGSAVERLRVNGRKMRRVRRTAKRELAKRGR